MYHLVVSATLRMCELQEEPAISRPYGCFPQSIDSQCKAMGTLNTSSCSSIEIGRVGVDLGLSCFDGT